MRKIFIILFLLIPLSLSATNYYVKNGGNNALAGTSDANAWETIAKVNAVSFNSGDSVLFKRGDTWVLNVNEPLNNTSNGIIYGAYGSGADPIFTGLTTVTGWTDYGGGIYYKAVSTESQEATEKVYIVTFDGKNTAMGREPDGSWLKYEKVSYTGGGQWYLVDDELGIATDWTGAEAVMQKVAWMTDRNPITDAGDDTLFYTKGSNWTPYAGSGYFIQNDIRTLDELGEWYYNGTNLYVYFGAEATGDHVVKMSTVNTAIYAYYNTGNTYTGIHVTGVNRYGILNRASTITVKNCTFDFIAKFGIYNWQYSGGSDFTITNNTFTDINSNAILAHGVMTASTISYNVFKRIGMIQGGCEIAASDYWGDAISDIQSGTLIEYNTIDTVGHNGIALRYGDNQIARYNRIDGFGFTRFDAGGIYVWDEAGNNTAMTLTYNIVLNSNQVRGGLHTDYTNLQLWGIYLDEGAYNTTVSYNTTENCETGGYFNLNAGHNTFTQNTGYNNGAYQLGLTYIGGYGQDVTNMSITYNKLIARDSSEIAFYYRDDDGHFLTSSNAFNYNYYARPVDDDYVISTYDSPTTTDYTLATWKTYSSQDASSNSSLGGTVNSTSKLHFIYNDTTINKTYTLSAGMKDVENNSYSGDIYLLPFTSLVLIGAGTVTETTNPPDVIYPTVTTSTITVYNAYQATLGGETTDAGGGTITDKGLCWNTTADPVITDSHVHSGTGLGAFTYILRGLHGSQTWHVRAFATNATGTSYGDDMTFTTPDYGVMKSSGKVLRYNGNSVIYR